MKTAKYKEVADYLGEGIHTGLRKWADSKEAHTAWVAIRDMPDEEWMYITGKIAKILIPVVRRLYKR